MADHDKHGIVLLGSKELGLAAAAIIAEVAPGLLTAFVTPYDLGDIRSSHAAIIAWGQANHVPVHTVKNSNELTSMVDALRPRVLIVVGWYRILSPDLLARVPLGAVGIHASLLPKYRGHAPLVWAIINGERETGVTLFHFSDGIDNGDVIDQEEFHIQEADDIESLLVHAKLSTVRLLSKYILKIYDGINPRRKQNDLDATYGGIRRPEDGRINWMSSSSSIYNFIRAQSMPYPGAFSVRSDGAVVRIYRSRIYERPYCGVAGVVGNSIGNSSIIACGTGAILAEHVVVSPESSCPLRHGDRLC